MYPQFGKDIHEMNQRYQLANIKSLEDIIKRLPQFKDILDKEFTELLDIEGQLERDLENTNKSQAETYTDAIVSMADLLGDIIVYCASEAMRWGLPMDGILMIIMASNTSKLGADGKPIIDPLNGKFEKGPHYWKPEPLIKYFLTNGPQAQIRFNRNESGVVTYELTMENPSPMNDFQQPQQQQQPEQGD
jgi:predicted HAD superfamily Cof-like phosphohydrolase